VATGLPPQFGDLVGAQLPYLFRRPLYIDAQSTSRFCAYGPCVSFERDYR
jgi:hypothetical protein